MVLRTRQVPKRLSPLDVAAHPLDVTAVNQRVEDQVADVPPMTSRRYCIFRPGRVRSPYATRTMMLCIR